MPSIIAETQFKPLAPSEREIVDEFQAVLEKRRKKADPVKLAQLASVAFSATFPSTKRENRLANAIARGLSARQQLIAEEGGSLSADEAAKEIGLSKTAILNRYHHGNIVGWREERQNAVRFPVWQFSEHRVVAGIEETLRVLNKNGRIDDWGRMLFFLQKNQRLNGRRPLDYLRENKLEPILVAAQAYVE
ncbi:MAG: hypothetical protein C5B50_12035 [Verrucomicrobia bacterium]|nr:MAG: hypothetical protein C5B50_12035 [Verrucomicrobiota bacterium]